MKNNSIVYASPLGYRKDVENKTFIVKISLKNGNTNYIILEKNNDFYYSDEFFEDISKQLRFYNVESLIEKYNYEILDERRYYSWEDLIDSIREISQL